MSLLINDDNYSIYRDNGKTEMGLVAPLALIGTSGIEDFLGKINSELYKIRLQQAKENPGLAINSPGFLRSNYTVKNNLVRFSSGEAKSGLSQTVRGHDVYIIADVLNRGATYKMRNFTVAMSPDEHFQDIKRTILAIGNKAERINVVMPYLYQSKQVLRQSRDSLDCSQMLKELVNLNVHSIITFEPHEPRIENAIPRIGLERIPGSYLLMQALLEDDNNLRFDQENLAIISPDEGAMKRGIFYSSLLGLQLSTFYRQRDYSNTISGTYPIKNYRFLGDEISGKNILIIDDMILSGSTMLKTAYRLREKHNVKDIYCLATFPIFTDGIADFNQAYKDNVIKKVYSTNLIYRSPEILEQEWYCEADSTPLIASLIDAINHNASISNLIDQTPSINALLAKRRNIDYFADHARH